MSFVLLSPLLPPVTVHVPGDSSVHLQFLFMCLSLPHIILLGRAVLPLLSTNGESLYGLPPCGAGP